MSMFCPGVYGHGFILQIRWADLVDELDLKVSGIVGDTLLSAAAVSYFGAFTAKYRSSLMEGWRKQCQLRSLPLSQVCHKQYLHFIGQFVLLTDDTLPADV